MLPKDGVRPQLIPEHEIECLSSPQAELLYEYMKEDQVIDPLKLGLCEYQAVEPINSYHEEREDDDSIVEVSPYEALVINDASKIGATESPFDLQPQQDVITTDQTPCPDCKVEFKLVKTMREHRATYRGPFPCPVEDCPAIFSLPKCRNLHLRAKHYFDAKRY